MANHTALANEWNAQWIWEADKDKNHCIRLLSEDATERCTLFDINFRPTDMSVDELENGFRELARRLHAPEFVEQRSKRFLQHLRAKVFTRNGSEPHCIRQT